jgi:hypothetical protein
MKEEEIAVNAQWCYSEITSGQRTDTKIIFK